MTTPPFDDPGLPQRLRAQAFIREGEARIGRTWFRSLTRFLDRVRPAVAPPGGPIDTGRVSDHADFWTEQVDAEILPEVRGVLTDAWRRVTQAGQPATDPWVSGYLNETGNRLVRLPDEVYGLIVAEVERGITNGTALDQVTRDVQTILTSTGSEYWPNRARTVARTECLPGSAVVDTARATAVYRRAYSGPWIEVVTESGRQISGTPNHPVLTLRGWVGLGDLTESDRLVCDSARVKPPGAPADVDVEQGPSTLAEIFDALSAVGVAERWCTTEPDFHGDGMNGYVDVLSSYGVLLLGLFAPVTERRTDGILAPSDVADVVLAAERAPFSRSVPVDQESRLGMGADFTPSVPYATENGFPAGSEDCSECGGALPVRVPACYLVNGEVVSTVRPVASAEHVLSGCAEASHGSRALDSSGNGVGSEPGLSGHGPVTEPGKVELDCVRSVCVTEWSGHVYNLTTLDGYYSINDGVYTGNTIGAVNAGVFRSAQLDAEQRGDPAPFKVWIATDDKRTRPSHNDADKQRTLLSEPFRVGGAQLLFPGDPRGPAREVISCRCSLLPIVLGEELDWTSRQAP